MFGSDQMVWPSAIERSVRVIKEAPFLTAAQKRDGGSMGPTRDAA